MTATGSEIAVVGIAGRFPGGKNVSEFWDNLKAGRESIAPPRTTKPPTGWAGRPMAIRTHTPGLTG